MFTPNFFRKRFYASFLGPQFSDDKLGEFLAACQNYDFYIKGIIVNLHQISFAVSKLQNSDIHVVGSIAYPLGCLPTQLKIVHAVEAINDGAKEVQVVMKVEALMKDDYQSAREDAMNIMSVGMGKIQATDLIANSAYLTKNQALQAARIALGLGATYVTNAGFGLVTKPDDIRMIRDALCDKLQIIASGGCRTAEQAIELIRAGSNNIGTSTLFDIVEQIEELIAL